MMNLERINNWSKTEAKEAFFLCCGSARWAAEMAERLPFESEEALKQAAEEIWQHCDEEDWLEAFSQHPRIGDLENLRKTFSNTAGLASREQSGVSQADEETLKALERGNLEYEAKNGFVFLVCAAGKSAEEMLAILKERLQNDTETEMEMAAREQAKITLLRLERIESWQS